MELCGALKNIVAIGAGFIDGLGLGGNTKAAVIRIGLVEMMRFCAKFYGGVKQATFFESCGVADMITTCYGGRNRKCAEAFVKTGKVRCPCRRACAPVRTAWLCRGLPRPRPRPQTWDELEAELLGGQKLQGTLTAFEVNKVLQATNSLSEFPFFTRVYEIAYKGMAPSTIVELPDPSPSRL